MHAYLHCLSHTPLVGFVDPEQAVLDEVNGVIADARRRIAEAVDHLPDIGRAEAQIVFRPGLQPGQLVRGIDAAGHLVERVSNNPALQKVRNPDGSTTYTIDLRSLLGNATGRAIALSFDLIGFGTTVDDMGSTVTVSDVRLLSAPIATDDVAALDEDTPATVPALANDGSTFGYVPVIVTQPAHGSVNG